MLEEPIISPSSEDRTQRMAADGRTFSVHEWRGSGPAYLHVHFEDDEAWHVLEGSLTFRFPDRSVEAGAGSTVFVPAGVAHTYTASDNARYLVILTPRLRKLISRLQAGVDPAATAEIFREHRSEILE